MNSPHIPIEWLYIGAAGEHYVMSECFRHNMEAFKLPIDRGFDLVVTHAYRHMRAQSTQASAEASPSVDMPFYMQVKSRQVVLTTPEKGDARPAWEGTFIIKTTDLELICRTPNAMLVCVLFIENRGEMLLSRTALAWWMSSAYVETLKRKKHFIPWNDGNCVELPVRYVEPAANTSYNQNPYVTLRRQNYSTDAKVGDLANGTLLDKGFFDLRLLGTPQSYAPS